MQQVKKQTPRRGPAAKGKNRAALSAQQTIPYVRMLPDGVCQLPGGLYTKTVEYEDINYSVASTEDQTAIFSGWSSFLNYFDSSLPFQLSFINRRSHSRSRYKVNIPQAEDDFNSVRAEFTGMLKNQIARSNNGIERSKYITFGIPAESLDEARPRLERVEADVMSNFKRLGVPSEPMDGRARLALLHGQMHPGSREPFRFSWGDIAKTGLGTKDFIAPDSFDFRQPRLFRMGQYWGAASYLQILASELSDKLLAEILELHSSTVSRAVRDKFLQCRQGTYPLRYFFSRSVGLQGMSRQAVKQRLVLHLKDEDPAHPLSDQTLCKLLEQEGIPLARRTVAKYRSELGIGSSTARRARNSMK